MAKKNTQEVQAEVQPALNTEELTKEQLQAELEELKPAYAQALDKIEELAEKEGKVIVSEFPRIEVAGRTYEVLAKKLLYDGQEYNTAELPAEVAEALVSKKSNLIRECQ